MSPLVHATLLGCAAVAALVFSGIILARSPEGTSTRLHAVYGGTVAWWLFSMAMVASAETPGRVQLWIRLAHVAIGMLPAVVYHVNLATVGLLREYRRSISVHYVVSLAVTAFCLVSPDLFSAPRRYPWGPYPAYTPWGAIPVGALLFVFAEVLTIYRATLRQHPRGTLLHERARVFYVGNAFTFLAALDFLPAFGYSVYAFGFVIITIMYAATMYASVRYRLIEITPEIAAKHIVDTMPDGLLVADTRGLLRLANRAAARLLGRRLDDLMDHPLESIVAGSELTLAFGSLETSRPVSREVRFTSTDGALRIIAVAGSHLRDPAGRLVATLWILHDLTEQRHAEEEKHRLEGSIRQTQKMESLGVMAGGIAHDFNNLLMVILGNAEVAQRKLKGGSAVQTEVQAIATAAEHAAELTSQLLMYAGRGTSFKDPVDLNALTREMTELMRSAISKKAGLTVELAEPLPKISGDRSQIRQVILNLITNASDALGDTSGTITIRTGVTEPHATLQRSTGDARERHSGKRVFLEVADTGHGMDPETTSKMFDPFFTTKFAGRGLGLATVLRIVEGHGGTVHVESARGVGTRITVAFGGIGDTQSATTAADTAAPDWRGTGVALLVDDEAIVRNVVREMLTEIGFHVLEAADGAEAVATFRAHVADVAVVVMDLTMPVMNGREAFAQIRSLSGAVPVVFVSGYSEVEDADLVKDARTSFLHKPFKYQALVSKIRELVAGSEAGPVGNASGGRP